MPTAIENNTAAKIAVGDTSTGHPSQWLADDKLVVAAPFLKKDGKLEGDKPATFIYRLIVHKEKWNKERIEQEESRFSSERQ